MAKAPERHYPSEEARRRAERMRELARDADRVAAPMFLLNIAEAELEAQGVVNAAAGEYLADIEIEGGEVVATIFKPEQKG